MAVTSGLRCCSQTFPTLGVFCPFQNMCNCHLAAVHTDLETGYWHDLYVCMCMCMCMYVYACTHMKKALLAGLKCNLTKGHPEPVPV